ncbi:CAP-Gly domain-containing linker protein 1-like [Pectinophora gossypiella]|uniref:CAP-Gly domain-containing linker protein 1-like n=1 Tax=Pectinophora gossypiella TaxID=13191 RepID=UPI00214E8AD8|nr:CAP-Gly domain-containing linker protein 1-like [Pectinophora gossypiella]
MDIAEINKVAGRKRMSTDVEKLREKVSRENKKIIKLKVAQDTAYWDLKEKLRQVETNHEKLQQNMLEVQMQYETVSGQYQDELRHRAETLNKLASTREICTVLEDYSERLRETLSRCKADQAALYEAYQHSGQVLREFKTQQLQQDEKNKQIIDSLQDKLKLTTEHHNQLLQYFTEEKQRAVAEIREVKDRLAAAVEKANELGAANNELSAQLEYGRRELEKLIGKTNMVLKLYRKKKPSYVSKEI